MRRRSLNTLKLGLAWCGHDDLLVFVAPLIGCQEDTNDRSHCVDRFGGAGEYAEPAPGEIAMERLGLGTFKNSIKDIFGEDVVVPKFSEPDTTLGGLQQ